MERTATLNKLEDVPLPDNVAGSSINLDDEIQNASLPNLAKPNSRTNSLKRFFKMNKKGDKEPETDADLKSKSENAFGAKSYAKKFHLRLGGFNKHATEGEVEAAVAAAAASTTAEAPVASASASATSATSATSGGNPKHGLKGSLSNYWNAIFKKNKKDIAENDGETGSSLSGSGSDEELDDVKMNNERGGEAQQSPHDIGLVGDKEKQMSGSEIHALTASEIDSKDIP